MGEMPAAGARAQLLPQEREMPGHMEGSSSGCPVASGSLGSLPTPSRPNMARLAGDSAQEWERGTRALGPDPASSYAR